MPRGTLALASVEIGSNLRGLPDVVKGKHNCDRLNYLATPHFSSHPPLLLEHRIPSPNSFCVWQSQHVYCPKHPKVRPHRHKHPKNQEREIPRQNPASTAFECAMLAMRLMTPEADKFPLINSRNSSNRSSSMGTSLRSRILFVFQEPSLKIAARQLYPWRSIHVSA